MARPNNTGAFDPRDGDKDFFYYGVNLASIAPAASASSSIQIDTDADFNLIALSYQADVAAAVLTESTNPLPLVKLLVTDTGSGKALMNTAVPLPAIAGDGKHPMRLIRPRVFKAGATIAISWTSYSAATTYQIFLLLHGFKVYR